MAATHKEVEAEGGVIIVKNELKGKGQNIGNKEAEPMTNLEYHKGASCVYLPTFCQEGYCSECEIYLKKRATAKLTDAMGGVRDIRKTRETATVSGRP